MRRNILFTFLQLTFYEAGKLIAFMSSGKGQLSSLSMHSRGLAGGLVMGLADVGAVGVVAALLDQRLVAHLDPLLGGLYSGVGLVKSLPRTLIQDKTNYIDPSTDHNSSVRLVLCMIPYQESQKR